MNKKTARIILFAILSLIAIITTIKFSGIHKPKKSEQAKTSGAYEALNLWTDQRAYPGKDIPSDKFFREFEKKALEKAIRKENSLDGEWKAIGPKNIGGRTLALAINPLNNTTLYAGSASGGLWRSFTAGEGASAWHRINTGYPVMAVGAIAIPNDDSSTIYIGTGEVLAYQNSIGGVSVRATRGSYGIGILKSTDAGATWSKSLDWTYQQERGVQVIKINPLNPNTVWAGTSEGIYKSLDAGNNWTRMNETVMVTDIAVHSVDTNNVVIACGNMGSAGNGIYRTTDGGETWVKKSVGLPSSYGGKALLSSYKSNPDIIYASIGNSHNSTYAATWLCKSTDAGNTWSTVSTFDYSSYQGWFAHFALVHPEDSSKLLVAGVDVFKSTNGGSSFSQKAYWNLWYLGRTIPGEPEGPSNYSHADHHCYAVDPFDPDVVYLGNDGGVFKTADFGETYDGRNGGYQSTQFYNGFTSSLSDSNLSMGGLQDNASAIYDGQDAWIRVIGGDGSWTGINQADNDILYGSYQYLNMRKSTDGGNNFYGIPYPPEGEAGFIAPFVLSFSDPNLIYAGKTMVYKSTNGGNEWIKTNQGNQLTPNLPISMAISYDNDDVVYLAAAPTSSRAQVFRTTNGGESWDEITNGLPDRYPMEIVVNPIDDNDVYIAFSGFGTSHVFKSTNKGDDWIDIGDGLPDVPTSALAVDPDYPDHIYAGTDLGIYVSFDDGLSWQLFDEGLPNATVIMTLSVSYSNRMLRAATHGNGVYERKMPDIPSSVPAGNSKPEGFALNQNYPNPFNPVTKISYSIPERSNVKINVYDITGRKVKTLINEVKEAGSYSLSFSGENLSSGTYFYTINAGKFSEAKKMTLLK